MATAEVANSAIGDDTLRPLAAWVNDPRLAWVPGARSRSSLHRWASIGCRGVRLKTVQTPTCRMCSYRDLMDFFARLGEATGCYSGGDGGGIVRA